MPPVWRSAMRATVEVEADLLGQTYRQVGVPYEALFIAGRQHK